MTVRPSPAELRHKILRDLSEHTTEVEWAGTGASRAYADTVIALADWLATTEPDVPARGPGASREAIDACIKAAAEAVRAAQGKTTTLAEEKP